VCCTPLIQFKSVEIWIRETVQGQIYVCKPSFFNCQLSLTLSQLVKLPSKIVNTAFGFQLFSCDCYFSLCAQQRGWGSGGYWQRGVLRLMLTQTRIQTASTFRQQQNLLGIFRAEVTRLNIIKKYTHTKINALGVALGETLLAKNYFVKKTMPLLPYVVASITF
jgi:hypothetical protein